MVQGKHALVTGGGTGIGLAIARALADAGAQVTIRDRAGVSEDEALNMMVRTNRHKRLIEPRVVSAAVMWLCGPGSQSINGQTIEIMGGQC